MTTATKEQTITSNDIDQDLLTKLNNSDTSHILNYGLNIQNQLGEQTSKMLSSVKACDTDKIGDELVQLIEALNNNENKKKNFFGIFKQKVTHTIDEQKSIEKLINEISERLQKDQLLLKQMLKDMVVSVNSGREFNTKIAKYIYTGKYKLSQLEEKELPELQEKVNETTDPIEKEKLQDQLIDMKSYYQQLRQRVEDLQGAKTLMQEQIVELQTTADSDRKLYSQITRTLNNTMTTWRSQIGLSVFLDQQRTVMDHTKRVNELTNKIIKTNSEVFKDQSISIARDQNKPEIDLQTLEEAKRNIVDAITEINKITEESANQSSETIDRLTELDKQTRELQSKVENSNKFSDKDLGMKDNDVF